MHPIGTIHSPFTDKGSTPIQSARSHATGQVQIDPAYAEGLLDIEGFSHLILLYAFHASTGCTLRVTPFLDDQPHGLFATRYPNRPNPLGLSVVELVGRNGNVLEIKGVDVLDGTPLLDLKPYVPEFDARPQARVGWLEQQVSNRTANA